MNPLQSIIHASLARLRNAKRVFRRWWRSKRSLDFLYWRVLRGRLKRESEGLSRLNGEEHPLIRVSEALSLLHPISIENPLLRVGAKRDGGYLLPQSAMDISILLSPGVGYEASFEEYFAARGVKCSLIDPTVAKAPLASSNVSFERLFLAESSGPGKISLDDWVAREGDNDEENLGLQMDIEGGEYLVLDAASATTLSRFSFMIIEFHALHHLVSSQFRNRFERILRKISSTHFVVHAHANNALPPIRSGGTTISPLVEIVAVKKHLVTPASNKVVLPHPLDSRNVPWRRDWPFQLN